MMNLSTIRSIRFLPFRVLFSIHDLRRSEAGDGAVEHSMLVSVLLLGTAVMVGVFANTFARTMHGTAHAMTSIMPS